MGNTMIPKITLRNFLGDIYDIFWGQYGWDQWSRVQITLGKDGKHMFKYIAGQSLPFGARIAVIRYLKI
jgi:hypothetical protein